MYDPLQGHEEVRESFLYLPHLKRLELKGIPRPRCIFGIAYAELHQSWCEAEEPVSWDHSPPPHV